MKKQLYLTLALLLLPIAWVSGARTPSTQGKDFWVTFLRADSYDKDDKSITLSLTFSTIKACQVTIEHPTLGKRQTISLAANSVQKVDLYTGTAREDKYNRSKNPWDCYTNTDGATTTTALHITSTEDISVFASNYKSKSFDATNVLPTSALLDEYYVQTYHASVHADTDQGAHFAVVAVEDNTVVNYTLTTASASGKTGTQTATLNRGEVMYIWSGKKHGDISDFSGTHIEAQQGKPIAVFQGCPHTNLPDSVRDRDHIFSQAMPIAYWGNEFIVTSSCHHRRDRVAIMAISDSTKVYINTKDGGQKLVHKFDFSIEPKHYWEFEIGESTAYCADDKVSSYGLLDMPLVADSSCFITTSCPVGVHLFMVSNRYDNAVPKVSSDTLVSDPAMLWISPVEQVINDITFSTFQIPVGDKGQNPCHYVNIVTSNENANTITLLKNGNNLPLSFHQVYGNSEYVFTRVNIDNTAQSPANYHLTGKMGFLAHVYGYGERESYAYSCGSSTVSRSVTVNGIPIGVDSTSTEKFCVSDTIKFKLNIGHNYYQKITYDFGDGTSETLSPSSADPKSSMISHKYETRGWYDVTISTVYVNTCTEEESSEDFHVSFYVDRPDTIRHETSKCVAWDDPISTDTITDTKLFDCDSVVITSTFIRRASKPSEVDLRGKDSLQLFGKWYYQTQDVSITHTNQQQCDSVVTYHITIVYCLDIEVPKDVNPECDGGTSILIDFNHHKGEIDQAQFIATIDGQKKTFPLTVSSDYKYFLLDVSTINPGAVIGEIKVHDPICDQTLTYPITVFVRLPNSILHQKYDNVVGVTLESIKQYNFQGYQWMIDGTLVPNKTESIYYQDNGFSKGQYIEVLVLLPNGKWIQSCKLNLVAQEDINNPFRPAEQTEAQKVMSRGNLYIQIGDQLYNTLGERVY